MRASNIVTALIVAPLIGGITYVLAASSTFGSVIFGSIGGRGADPRTEDLVSTLVGAAVVAVIFEVFILLPTAYGLRAHRNFRAIVVAVGVVAWIALTAGGLALIGQNPISVAFTSAQLLALGVPVVLAFTLIVQRGLHA